MLDIERLSFGEPWSLASFRRELSLSFSRLMLAVTDESGEGASTVAGYLCRWLVAGEYHILNIAAHPDFRRRGVGTSLMAEAVAEARARKVSLMILEVRRSNLEARRLYRKFGFEERRLQVAAVDHPIGGAPALRGGGGERRARQHARSPRAHHPQLLRRDRAALEALAQPERDQHACGIGRELNAGADLLQALRLLEHRDLESALRDRQRRGQSADARAGDEHGARGWHGS